MHAVLSSDVQSIEAPLLLLKNVLKDSTQNCNNAKSKYRLKPPVKIFDTQNILIYILLHYGPFPLPPIKSAG